MTTKSTVKVNGGAMPKFNRRAITARAWEIFRDVYHYGRHPGTDAGGHHDQSPRL